MNALQHALGQLRLDDDRQVRVHEAHRPRVHDLDLHVAERRPVGVQARRQHVAEPAVDPDQGALVVLEVEHLGPVVQHARLHDDVELLVDQPRRALRHDIDAHAAQRVEEPVPARLEQTAELAVVEVQADFVLVNLDELDDHVAPPLAAESSPTRRHRSEKRLREAGHPVDPTDRRRSAFELARPSGSVAARLAGGCGGRGRTSTASCVCRLPEAAPAVSTHCRAAVRVASTATVRRADRTSARLPRAGR